MTQNTPFNTPERAPMPTWAKVLIGLAVFVFVAGGACTIATFVVGKKIFSVFTAAGNAAQESSQEARTFGATHPKTDCMPESLRRGRLCTNLDAICSLRATQFFSVCLQSARPAEGVCQAVPTSGNAPTTGSWTQQFCAANSTANDLVCPMLAGTLLSYCQNPDGFMRRAGAGANQ
jgi:hypothetical protein